ncbi:hypothetical protein [Streptomyces sp. NPDC048361]|uniref:hypothetical protein n=1 Tax=Streptomyces sp. NPDC048361 TaxID=3154720 RepID=UPI0034305819
MPEPPLVSPERVGLRRHHPSAPSPTSSPAACPTVICAGSDPGTDPGEAFTQAVELQLPEAHVIGSSAGLHACLQLPDGIAESMYVIKDAIEEQRSARNRSLDAVRAPAYAGD